jgi:hypothetical protein
MLFPRLLPIAVLALSSVAAIAQEAPPPAPAQAEVTPTMMPNDCASQATRHDHGAERGTPAARMAGCAMASPAASAGTAKPKAKPGHDHGKVHKLM